MFYDEDTEEVFKVDQIVWIDKINPSTKKGFGWSVSSLPCDVDGTIGEDCYINGVLKDTAYEQYTLTGNRVGCDMDDMIDDYKQLIE